MVKHNYTDKVDSHMKIESCNTDGRNVHPCLSQTFAPITIPTHLLKIALPRPKHLSHWVHWNRFHQEQANLLLKWFLTSFLLLRCFRLLWKNPESESPSLVHFSLIFCLSKSEDAAKIYHWFPFDVPPQDSDHYLLPSCLIPWAHWPLPQSFNPAIQKPLYFHHLIFFF